MPLRAGALCYNRANIRGTQGLCRADAAGHGPRGARPLTMEAKIMDIEKTKTGTELTLALDGRLDTATAPRLEAELGELSGVGRLVIDMGRLVYVSSAGLRVLLKAQKTLTRAGGGMVLRNVSQDIRDIFEVTGFDEILTIEG